MNVSDFALILFNTDREQFCINEIQGKVDRGVDEHIWMYRTMNRVALRR